MRVELQLVINVITKANHNYQLCEPSPWKAAERGEWLMQLAKHRDSVGVCCVLHKQRTKLDEERIRG